MKPAAISFCCPFAAFDFYEKKPESVPQNDLSLHFQLYGRFWLLLLKKKYTWWLALEIRCHGCREQLQIPSLFAIKQGKKCWALSLSAVLPEAAGSQDPQVFSRSPTPVENPPFPPRRLTSVARSCCFSPLQIRLEGHCEMSALFRKALMYTDQHPAIIQSRCHLSVSLEGVFCSNSRANTIFRLLLEAEILWPLVLCVSPMLPVNTYTSDCTSGALYILC